MATESPLFEMVHSLSQSEKRYFRLYAKRHALKGQNKYLSLFDLLLKQEVPDDNALKRSYTSPHFASDKNYLQQLLLKAMRAFHAGKTPKTKVQEYLRDLEFLGEKRLFKHSRKLLKKAKQIAKEAELFPAWLQLIQFERRYAKFIYRNELSNHLSQIADEFREVRQRMDTEFDYIEVTDQLLALLRRRHIQHKKETLDQAEAFLLDPLLTDPNRPSSFHSQSYFHLARAYTFQILGDAHGFMGELSQNIHHWSVHPHRIKEEPHQFQRSLSNYLGACHQLSQYQEFPKWLEKMEALPKKSIQEKAEHFSNCTAFRLIYWMNSAQWGEAVASSKGLVNQLKKFKAHLPPSRALTLHYNLAVLFLYTEQHSLAVRQLTEIIHQTGEVRQDLHRKSHFLLLALHYDLGNLDLADFLLQNAHRMAEWPTPLEEHLLRFFQQLYNLPLGEAKRHCKDFELVLNWEVGETKEAHKDLLHWVRAKAAEKKMVE